MNRSFAILIALVFSSCYHGFDSDSDVGPGLPTGRESSFEYQNDTVINRYELVKDTIILYRGQVSSGSAYLSMYGESKRILVVPIDRLVYHDGKLVRIDRAKAITVSDTSITEKQVVIY